MFSFICFVLKEAFKEVDLSRNPQKNVRTIIALFGYHFSII